MSRPGADEAWGVRPAALLAPERGVVPFMGRGRELADLRAWVRSREPVALRLLCGLGGVGKTRLALELGRRMRRTGWTVVHVPPGQEVAAVAGVATARRALLVVDDAGSRPGLSAMLDAVGETRAHGRLRVLCIARTGGQWWRRVRWTSTLWAGRTPSVTQMALEPALDRKLDVAFDPALGLEVDRSDDDRALLEAFVTRFARVLGRPVPEVPFEPAPDQRLRVLDLHAAALAAVLDGGRGAPGARRAPALDAVDAVGALDVVLDHERAAWAGSAAAAGLVAGPGGTAEAALATATLLGDTSDDGVRAALRRAGVEPAPGRTAEAVTWVRAHLLGVPRLAELLVSRVLGASAELTAACTRDLEPGEALGVLAFATGMSLDRPAAGPDVTGELIAAAASALPDERPEDLAGLMRVARWLPRSSGPLVVPVLDRVTHRVAELARTVGDEAERGEALSDLGVVLVAEGDPSAAVPVLREAVGLWRGLAWADEDRYRPPLCTALNNLGLGYWGVGRHRDALAVQEEVIALCGRFPPGDAPWADAEHARALQNAGVSYTELGRVSEIEPAQRASLDIYRRLAEGDPVQYEPRVAAVLGNFEALTENGRPDDALPANAEAVAIRRRLAAARPEHLGELAWSLGQLGTTLEALGRYEEAGTVLVEALEIQRRLAKENARGTRADLAGALSALGALYSTTGRADESIRLEREALEIRRELTREHPERYLHYLAHSLSNLGVTYARRGRYDEAVLLEEEALGIRRGLASQNARSLKYLAQSLSNLGVRYADLGRFEESLRPTQEAVDMLRRLVREQPEKYRTGLAEALANLGATLLDLDKAEDALRPMREAVAMRRQLAVEHPDKHRPDLALAISNLASALSATGDNVAALGHAREAVEMRRRLAADLPERYRAELERSRAVLARVEAAIRNPPPVRSPDTA
ncbi:tetratricopeptide repeat protein [Promicromonospora sp. AC04]|uniref:tetratricopeptide repeat protein n=1 Tax=Promicromonospora sp. AC04 TaxID=2135723 RepID=UPI000D39F8A5|nr:tetratricopeptide repeat protein [Promicromonospora sp. AC04]PUB25326.1 tetratricopeptide repeat protein [Promicromonospora sp. AC04]